MRKKGDVNLIIVGLVIALVVAILVIVITSGRIRTAQTTLGGSCTAQEGECVTIANEQEVASKCVGKPIKLATDDCGKDDPEKRCCMPLPG